MTPWTISFGYPGFLGLILLIPGIWLWGYPRLRNLGRVRKLVVLLLRCVVFTLLVLSLSDLHLHRKSDRLTVMFLLDQSASIPAAAQDAMVAYVREEVLKNRRESREDRAGIIVFGRSAQMEIPPLDDQLPLAQGLEGIIDLRTDATNLESALQLAQATFPEDAAKRVVIVTDGNENLGNAMDAARRLAQDGVSIDVIAVRPPPSSDILVEQVLVPAELRQDTSFEARVVLNHTQAGASGEAVEPAPVAGKLRIRRRRAGQETIISDQDVTLPPGKTVLSFRDELSAPDFYEYDATFVANNPEDDPIRQNNTSTSFTHIRGSAHVLIIEDIENRTPSGEGESAFLVSRLNAMNIATTVRFSNELYSSLAELQPYDCVILSNVSRSGGLSDAELANFSDAQIDMLVQNTREMGCGLIMLGGKNSYGAGGWANSALEAAMPVDCQIKNSKVQAIGALAMVMHASEMANGNYWQKVIAREAVKVLGPFDYCGVIHWGNMGEEWLWNTNGQGLVRVGQNKSQMLARLDRMTPGDMPEFESSLRLAVAGFSAVTDAAVKHMIIISDGDPTPPQFQGGALSKLKNLGVQVTTVAVGTHGDPITTPLKNIATFTGGKYYVVKSAKSLPRIFQREARRVSKPLIVERELQPEVIAGHEIVDNLGRTPPITGFVMTSIKKNPLVEVQMRSPYPTDSDNATLLATWTYGVGRVAALTTDSGARWSSNWTSWEEYDRFFGQLVRWAIRPNEDSGQFSVSTQLDDGKVRVVVDVIEAPEGIANEFTGNMLNPLLRSQPLELRRTSPTRFETEFPVDIAGSYFMTLRPNPQSMPLRIGVNVPYSSEYRYLPANDPLLNQLVDSGEGKTSGYLHPDPLTTDSIPRLVQHDAFRRDTAPSYTSRQVWPWLLIFASHVFFGDILVRRVAIDFSEWQRKIRRAWRSLQRHEGPNAETFESLRKTKAKVGESLERKRTSLNFEPISEEIEAGQEQVNLPAKGMESQSHHPAAGTPTKDPPGAPTETDESFTARLLRAKKNVQKDKESDRPPPDPGALSS